MTATAQEPQRAFDEDTLARYARQADEAMEAQYQRRLKAMQDAEDYLNRNALRFTERPLEERMPFILDVARYLLGEAQDVAVA